MRRKATTVFATLLILWGLSSVFLPRGATLYTPYSSYYMGSGSILEAETASLTAVGPGVSYWTLLLIGCVLVSLMQAPKRVAILAMILYGAAALIRFAPMISFALEKPRRYHYYYVPSESEAVFTGYAWAPLLLLAIGLLASLLPPLVQRVRKSRAVG